MPARNNQKYFLNYIMFTNVYATNPGVYNCKLTHQKCSNTILLELEFIQLLFQFSPVIQSCPTLYLPTDCSMPGFPVHPQLPELTQTHVHPVDDAIQPSHPLSSPFPPASVFPSIRVFSNESVLRIRWPKYWSLQLQHLSFQ